MTGTTNLANHTNGDPEQKQRVLFGEESYEIIGACFEVYNEMGCGFLESVYQECVRLEFNARGIPHIEKPRLRLRYKHTELEKEFQPDFLCFGKVIVEIKAVKQLADELRAQTINYLKATQLQLGLLVNFGHPSRLEYERFVNQYPRHSRDS